MTLQHSLFGSIDISKRRTLQATSSLDGTSIALDLNLDGHQSLESVTQLLSWVDKLPELDRRARAALSKDVSSGDEDASTLLYVEHHRDELPDAAIEQLFGSTDRALVDGDSVLPKLQLLRAGLYPEAKGAALVLDYSLSASLTNYVLCVTFDEEGHVSDVTVES